MRYVYIVRCNDTSLYTGITNNVEKRISDHNSSKTGAKYTKSRRPVALVWSQKVGKRNKAATIEYAIKRLKKEQKENIISSGGSIKHRTKVLDKG